MDGGLQRGNGPELVRAQELQLGVFDVRCALTRIVPSRIVAIRGILRQGDLRLQNGERETAGIQKQVIDKAVRDLLEVIAEVVEGQLFQLDVRFEGDIRGAVVIIK